MQLTIQLTREIAGNRVRQPVLDGTMEFDDPVVRAAVLHMNCQPTRIGDKINYRFTGEATLSFIDDQLDDERCHIQCNIFLFHNNKTYSGSVTYTDLQGSTLIRGLYYTYFGQMQFPGPVFYPSPSRPQDMRLIEPNLQQLMDRDLLFIYGYKLVEAVFYLIISAED